MLTGAGQDATVAEHLVITVGAGARATIVLRYTGVATFADKTDLVVGDGASVTFVTIADWDAGAVHGGHHAVLVGRDARVRVVTASLGGDVVRLAETARFAGPGGELEQFGVYFRRRRPAHRAPPVRRPQCPAHPAAGSTIAAPCRARAHTRSGWATC